MCILTSINGYSRYYAYTLLETLVTTSFLVITVSLAAPNLHKFIDKNTLLAESRKLEESLRLARSTAIAKHAIVVICPLTNTGSCKPKTNANERWLAGWQVFIDANNNKSFDANDKLIKKYSGNAKVSVVFNQNGILRFFPNGSARSAGFYVCSERQKPIKYHRLLHSGRSRQSLSITERQESICRTSL